MKRGLGFLILGILFLSNHSGFTAPLRLAVIAPEPDLQTEVDVITAVLSSHPDLTLLERSEIQKVYNELAISGGQSSRLLKLGEVMSADGLVVLEKLELDNSRLLTLKLIAVRPGAIVSFADYSWPLPDVASWATTVTNRIVSMSSKLVVPKKDAVPVSILGLRSVLESDSSSNLERQLDLLLKHRLMSEKQVFVLERNKLDALADEKALNRLEESAFWNGSYIIDGSIEQHGEQGEAITINCRLRKENNDSLSLVSEGAVTNLASIIDGLTSKILVAMEQVPATAPWTPGEEANRYGEEAKWALKWQVFERAQQAADSSWILGNKTLEMAQVRIKSYGLGAKEGVNPQGSYENRNLGGPYPPPQRCIIQATRALELFESTTHFLKSQNTELNFDWYGLGVDALEAASAVLRLYYFAAEAREGKTDELSHLRFLCRTTTALMTREPKLSDSFWERDSRLGFPSKGSRHNHRNIHWVMASQGYLWYERPQDTLKHYKELFDSPHYPQLRPYLFQWGINGHRLLSWDYSSQPKLNSLFDSFVEDLSNSTNLALKIEGHCLALAPALARNTVHPDLVLELKKKRTNLTPVLATNSYFKAVISLFDVVWDYREELFSDPETRFFPAWTAAHVSAVIRRSATLGQGLLPTVEAFTKKVSDFDQDWRLRPKLEYLSGTNYDLQTFRSHFSTRHMQSMSLEDALKLHPYWTEYRNRLPKAAQEATLKYHTYFLSKLTPKRGRRPVTKVLDFDPKAPNVLQVDRRWSLKIPPTQPGWDVRANIRSSTYENGTLWIESAYSESVRGQTQIDLKVGVFGVNLRTLESESVFFIPAQVNRTQLTLRTRASGSTRRGKQPSGRRILPLGDYLFSTYEPGLQRYNLRTKEWSKPKLPLKWAVPYRVSDKLLLSTVDSLVEVHPETFEMKVLASTRRRPAKTQLDKLESLDFPKIISGADGSIRAKVRETIYELDSKTGDWIQVFHSPKHLTAQHAVEGGVLVFHGRQLSVLHNGKRELESTLTAGAPESEQWQFPANIQPQHQTADIANQTVHILGLPTQNSPSLKTTLFHFDPKLSVPIEIPVVLNGDPGATITSISKQTSSFTYLRTGVSQVLLMTAEGPVLLAPDRNGNRGFWHIPLDAYEKAVAANLPNTGEPPNPEK